MEFFKYLISPSSTSFVVRRLGGESLSLILKNTEVIRKKVSPAIERRWGEGDMATNYGSGSRLLTQTVSEKMCEILKGKGI
jgi:hypothetical protein